MHLHTWRNTRLIVGDNHLITLSLVYCNNSRFDARQSYVSRHKFSNVPDRHLQTPSLIQPPQVDDPPRQLLELQDPSHLRFPLQEGMLGGEPCRAWSCRRGWSDCWLAPGWRTSPSSRPPAKYKYELFQIQMICKCRYKYRPVTNLQVVHLVTATVLDDQAGEVERPASAPSSSYWPPPSSTWASSHCCLPGDDTNSKAVSPDAVVQPSLHQWCFHLFHPRWMGAFHIVEEKKNGPQLQSPQSAPSAESHLQRPPCRQSPPGPPVCIAASHDEQLHDEHLVILLEEGDDSRVDCRSHCTPQALHSTVLCLIQIFTLWSFLIGFYSIIKCSKYSPHSPSSRRRETQCRLRPSRKPRRSPSRNSLRPQE